MPEPERHDKALLSQELESPEGALVYNTMAAVVNHVLRSAAEEGAPMDAVIAGLIGQFVSATLRYPEWALEFFGPFICHIEEWSANGIVIKLEDTRGRFRDLITMGQGLGED